MRSAGRHALLRLVVIAIAVVLLSADLALRNPDTASAAAKPDIIVVMVDDLGAIDERVLERLPNIKSLWLDGGLRFDNAYAETPLCCPGRASFLTGQHTKRHGVTRNDGRLLNPNFTIATNLHNNGYYTVSVGRYLNRTNSIGDKTPRGWDRMAMLLNWERSRSSSWSIQGAPRAAYHMDRFLSTQSVAWLRNAPARRPIFMWLTPFAPHFSKEPRSGTWGLDVEARYANDSRCEGIEPWKPPTYRNRDRPDGFPLDDVCRSLLTVDEMVGSLRSTAAAEGRDPTWIFTSDNGMSWGRDGIRGKEVPQSDRVPLYFAGPRVQPGATTALVSNIDLGPTIAAMAGTRMPYADGASYLPVVLGLRTRFRSWLLEDHPQSTAGPWWGIRTPHWHLVEWPTRGEALYRTADDPWEQTNLAAVMPAAVERLKGLFAVEPILWRKHPPDPTPTPTLPSDTNARFVSQVVPANMLVGEPYGISVTFENSGSTTWTQADGFALGSPDAEIGARWRIHPVGLPNDVAPGQQVTLEITVTAPHRPWFYYLQLQLVDGAGAWFGDQTARALVDVDEVYGPPAGGDPGG